MPSRAAPVREPVRLLRSLNLVGLDFLDPVVLAALADERPLLLIGPHGTAKSELLNRLAGALGLSHRHFNASLISFDDLLGYPVPEPEASTIRYLRTPGDLWDAESVFLDEISRCRPETQNKLFSVIHEKRVQGLPLDRLRYRWAAMNPPIAADSDADDGYEGSLPLDAALADRFGYVVELPALLDLPPEDRVALIREGGSPPPASAGARLRELVDRTCAELAATPPSDTVWAARYVSELVTPLAEAQLAISGRRAVMLAGCIQSVAAASRVLGQRDRLSDCALLALRSALPQRARGLRIEGSRLAAIHRLAVKAAGEPSRGAWHRIRAQRDPVARVAEALRHYGRGIDRAELSALVSDAFASLTVPRQYLFARHVLPLAAERECLTVPAYELLATPLARLVNVCDQEQLTIALPRQRMREWNAVSGWAHKLSKGTADDAQLANILLTLVAVEEQVFDADELVALDRSWAGHFGPAVEVAEPVA
jgi:MoxR-like ATPase